ncbi:DotD/TraH family lipoprotein [Cysteiniphilum litorale]|uniref:DotD/TraH family lipoprotein n=1 Tax=Cysteiniphilum litorale TaxID=2056700 RepID=UPI003F885BE9
MKQLKNHVREIREVTNRKKLKKIKKGVYQSTVSVLALGMLMLSGCATNQVATPPRSNEPLYALDTVAVQTSQNIQTLTEIKTAELHKTADGKQWQSFMFNLQSIPVNFEQKTTFHFVGTAQEALKGIADLAGYQASFIGNPPAQPIMVTIDLNNQSLVEGLRDLNAQLNNKAIIQLAPTAKLVTMSFGA